MATRTFGRLCPWAALCAVVLLSACVTPGRSGPHGPAQRAYDEGLTHFNLGDYSQAIDSLQLATLRVDGGEFKADIEYQLGRSYLENGQPLAAIEHFGNARDHTGRSLQLFRIWKGQADAHYRVADYSRAATAYRECLAHESDPIFLDEVYYRLAVSLRGSGDAREAADYLSRVRSYRPRGDEPTYESVGSGRGKDDSWTLGGSWSDFSAGISRRTDWGARPTRANFDKMTPIYRITIHHSAMTSSSSSKRAVALEIRNIQKTHQDGRHWADIGYHFVIDRAGRVWEGRPIDLQGAHAGNSDLNRGNVGIVLLGNFNVQGVNRGQEHALRMLTVYLVERYRVDPQQIHTHRELKSTECPGRDLQRFVDGLRDDLTRGDSMRNVAFTSEMRHLVERGETLFSIAKRYGVNVAELRDANGTIQGDRVLAGQELRIPGGQPR